MPVAKLTARTVAKAASTPAGQAIKKELGTAAKNVIIDTVAGEKSLAESAESNLRKATANLLKSAGSSSPPSRQRRKRKAPKKLATVYKKAGRKRQGGGGSGGASSGGPLYS